jgi:hypothetical protein
LALASEDETAFISLSAVGGVTGAVAGADPMLLAMLKTLTAG